MKQVKLQCTSANDKYEVTYESGCVRHYTGCTVPDTVIRFCNSENVTVEVLSSATKIYHQKVGSRTKEEMNRILQTVAKKCLEAVEALNIPHGDIKQFIVNHRSKRRWGKCVLTPLGYEIEISYRLLENDDGMEGLKNTLFHEILHSCPGCMNHGEAWKQYATSIYHEYGYNIKRCSTAEEKGVVDIKPEYKYKVYCPKCNEFQLYVKKSKAEDVVKRYICGRCFCHYCLEEL